MQHNSYEGLLRATYAHEPMLVAPFMPVGGHCLLHGKRGLGKTQFAHTLAIDVAMGLPFLGDYATAQGTVVYIQADMTPQLQTERVKMLDAALHLPYDLPLHYFTSTGRLDCIDACDEGAAWAEKLQSLDPSLVVIDTLRKSHSLDENHSDTPVQVYAAWRLLCGPRPTILYIHHDRKTSEIVRDKDEEFRGTGAWIDEADLGMHLCKSRGGIHLEWSKLRTCSDRDVQPAINLRMDPDSLLMLADDPVEAYIKDACRRQLPRAQILTGAQDATRWGERAMSRATAFRRLQTYEPHEARI